MGNIAHATCRVALPFARLPCTTPHSDKAATKGGHVERKDRLDGFGGSVLLGVTLLLAFNQIIVKLVNEGLQPVFFAGLRS